VDSRESLLIVLAVKLNMVRVFLGHSLHHSVDVWHTLGAFTHDLGGEVSVAS